MVEKTVLKTKKNEERTGKSEIELTEEENLTAEWLRYLYLKHAFNSLSRDHRARFRDFPALRGFLPRHLFA